MLREGQDIKVKVLEIQNLGMGRSERISLSMKALASDPWPETAQGLEPGKDVTGRVFEVQGGEISIADGWRTGPKIDKGARWAPDEVGAVIHELLAKALAPQKVYGT